jgi:PKD repeat protein
VIGPLLVQFTDTTTPAATSWAWDFNGDTVVDSTAQNPVYAFPSSSPQNVRLTASRLCAAASTVTKSVSPLQQLSTNLIANNSIGTPATLYLNLDVFNPAGATITSLDSYSATLNAAFTVDVFLKQGLYQGSELNATPWTKVATASGTSAPATGQPSNVTFPLPLHIPQGSYGVAMRFVGITPRYVANTGLLTYNNTDLAITVGAVSLSTSGAFTGTSLLPSRAWSGTLYYTTNNVGNFAGYGWFGQGCPSTLGRTNIVGTNRPTLGGTLTTSLDNLPWGIAVMVLGLSNTVSGGTLPLPLDVGFLGAPGCSLRVSLDVTDTVVGTAPNGAWSLAIPNDPLLMGFLVYNQAAVFDPAANTFGFALSHAYGSVLGN